MKSVEALRSTFLSSLVNIYDANECNAIFNEVMAEHFHLDNYHSIPKEILSEDYSKIENDILPQLIQGKPLQYLLGYTRFCGLKILVNESVLIPRPETEELVQKIIQQYSNQDNLKVLDVCTGSGCIAIALNKNLKNSGVIGIEISSEALSVAKRNAAEDNSDVEFLKLDALNEYLPDELKFDIIVSNPPYVMQSESEKMHAAVLHHEPHIALFVPDNDALIFYRKIIQMSMKNLKKGGMIFFEINPLKANELENLLKENLFSQVTIENDLSNHARFISAKKDF